ncbi:hypothetical protein ACP4OV_004276 [Aristida adscensionis]
MAGPRAVHRLLAVVSLLAFALSCSAAPPPVYDTDGHELSADAKYYVLPAAGGHGGGLTMARHTSECPLFVAQATDELRKGFPVRFTPLPEQQGGGGGDRTVRVSTDVGIYFAAVTTCVQTTEWHVPGGGEPRRRHVVTGPVRSRSPSGREKVFRVERHGGAYKLASCSDSCRDLGVFRDETPGASAWLGASDDGPHVVVFKKAPPF